MKKFLRLDLHAPEKEIPADVDAVILAHAAIKAVSFRKKERLQRILFPAASIGAVAATLIVCLTPETAPQPSMQGIPAARGASAVPASRPVSVQPQAAAAAQPAAAATVTAAVQASEMLALADTTALEQECYNLTVMTDESFGSDEMFI